MIISDLNYLETTDGSEVVGGGGVNFNSRFNKNVNVRERIDLQLRNRIDSKVDITGNAAEAEGVADAFGNNTKTVVLVGTQTTGFSSESFGKAVSATD